MPHGGREGRREGGREGGREEGGGIVGLLGWGLLVSPPRRISTKLLGSPANGKTGLTRGIVCGMLGPQSFGTWKYMPPEWSPLPAHYRGGGLVVPVSNRGEPGVHRVSILMCVRPQWRVCHDSLCCGAFLWLKVWV